MNQAERDAAIAQCERLVLAFARAVDSREPERLHQVFTTDCWFERRGERLEGLAALLASQAAQPATLHTLHVCTNICVDLLGPEEATGLSYFTMYRYVGDSLPGTVAAADVVGRYHDRFVRTADGWRIAQRRAEAVFRAAAQ